jgi:hypothetical protein
MNSDTSKTAKIKTKKKLLRLVISQYHTSSYIWMSSCRTVALWFYNLVSDHNDTDPVMQKSCNLHSIFSAHFTNVFLHFPA